ncbi:hypothetical protein LTR62_000678 [Meristemomyces frigidus]|uniref:F-box domain-containing protein n=1 Tax=Meristemomyces frigidus TaxID=1508187 RepID=A0AAN7T918_9PEZI|nr:hypothetical protein LTR62_000678 [Meristemomyces frigidus]
MRLLELPTELLVQIIAFTPHPDLDHFCLSCRAVRKAGEEILTEHHLYQRRWKSYSLATAQNLGEEPQTVLALILAILMDSRVAEYIEVLNLREDSCQTELDPRVEDILRDESNRSALAAVVADSPFPLSDLWAEEDWPYDAATRQGGETWHYVELCTIVLLSLLPNLRTLTLPFEWTRTRHLRQDTWHFPREDRRSKIRAVLDVMVAKANEGTDSDTPLAKLETLYPYSQAQYDPRNGLRELTPFLPLKGLTELYTSNMVAVEAGHGAGMYFDWYHSRNPWSSLRKIQLAGCCMTAYGIGELVQHTPLLTSLAYSHHAKYHGISHDWDAAGFIAAIGKYRGDTLTELSVTIDALFGMIEHGVTSLKEFKKLETIELDVQVFAGPSFDAADRVGEVGQGNAPVGHIWSPRNVPRLLHMLPSRIWNVQLFVPAYEGEVTKKKGPAILARLLKGLEGEDGEFMIAVRTNREGEEWVEVQSVLAKNGLLASRTWLERVRGRTMYPVWKEEFIERFGDVWA